MKKLTFLLGLACGVFMFLTGPAAAQVPTDCVDATTHHPGTPSDDPHLQTQDDSGGEEHNQCHGDTGDYGNCTHSNGGNYPQSAYMFCGLIGPPWNLRNICYAELVCNGQQKATCSIHDGMTFPSIVSGSGEDDTVYIACEENGSAVVKSCDQFPF